MRVINPGEEEEEEGQVFSQVEERETREGEQNVLWGLFKKAREGFRGMLVSKGRICLCLLTLAY